MRHDPFDLKKDDRKALCRQLSDHRYQRRYAEAADVAERLFGAFDLDRHDLPVGLFETAMQDRMRALAELALAETDLAARREKMARSVARPRHTSRASRGGISDPSDRLDREGVRAYPQHAWPRPPRAVAVARAIEAATAEQVSALTLFHLPWR